MQIKILQYNCKLDSICHKLMQTPVNFNGSEQWTCKYEQKQSYIYIRTDSNSEHITKQ